MLLKIEPRPQPSQLMGYLSPLIAVGLTLVTGIIFSLMVGLNPWSTFYAFFISPIDDLYGLGELGVKAAPLMLIAVGLAIGFRSNVWNIGAEGQLTVGAIFGGGVALYFYEVESAWVLPLMVLAGAVGGMAWASIPALLRTRFNTNEILVSLMLNYVAIFLLSYLVHDPWRDPDGFNFPESRLFSDSALLPIILEGTRLHLGFIFALIAVVLGWIFVRKSFVGYQMQVAGLADMAALYAGFKRRRHGVDRPAGRRRRRRHRRHVGGRGAHRPTAALGVARLRLRRHHRCFRRAAAPGGDPAGEPFDVAPVSRR